jgi:hypothetical protein
LVNLADGRRLGVFIRENVTETNAELKTTGRKWSGFQPEGLSESSRWSQRSADHRMSDGNDPDPERVSEIVAPLRGADGCSPISGGLRYAPTTGYYLTAFLSDKRFSIPRLSLQNLLLAPRAIEYAQRFF